MFKEEEIAKHKKKKKSDVSKSERKAKHKHIYQPCLLFVNAEYLLDKYMGSSYCTVCGKIGGRMLGGDMVKVGNYIRSLTKEELIEKYKNYPTFEIGDLFEGYVRLVSERENNRE